MQVWCTLKLKTFVFLLPAQVLDTVVDFRVHQTCTRTKKTKVLNFKGHQTCTGTKKNKKNKEKSIYWRRVDYPSKVFVFLSLCRFGAFWSSKLLFFGSCAGLVHFEAYNVGFFVPVQVVCTFKFKTQCMVTCVLWHYFHCSQVIVPLLAFLASHAAFWRVRYIFRAKGWQFEDKFDPFQKHFLFSGYCSFFILKCQYISKSYALRMHFLLVFAVCLNMWSYSFYSYLVWWPPPQELELALGGWPHIYIYIHTYIHTCIHSVIPSHQQEERPLEPQANCLWRRPDA